MKKLALSALIAGAFLSSSALAATPITVNGGTITFKGDIVEGACSISGADQLVPMDSVKASTFTQAGQAANAKKEFQINLTDCSIDTYTKVSTTFTGQPDTTNPALLGNNNAGSGAATGVGLRIYGQNGAAVALGTKEATSLNMVTGSNTLRYAVDYVSTSATVTSGPVLTAADFQLTYE